MSIESQRALDRLFDELTVYAKDKECRCCGSRIIVAWNDGNHRLRCKLGFTPQIWKPPHYARRREMEMTKSETLPATQDTMLARINESQSLGLFPDRNTNAAQLGLLARVALAYGLDPFMGEIIPFQGKPYITIAGRRRLDAQAGHHTTKTFRPLSEDEERYYKRLGALDDGDVAGYCIATDITTGASVEGFGRVLQSEDAAITGNARHFVPVVIRKIEMAQKRQERRALEMLYGPVERPAGLEGVEVFHEGDVVDGETQTIDGHPRPGSDAARADAEALGQGDLGRCPTHNVLWAVRENKWGISASHALGHNEYCRYGKVYGAIFQEAYIAQYGEYVKADADAWLKEHYKGQTWSKMDPLQQAAAVNLLVHGLLDNQPQEQTEELPEEKPEEAK